METRPPNIGWLGWLRKQHGGLKQAEALAAAQQSIAANSWVIDHHVLLVIHGSHLFCLTHLCGVMWGHPEIAISIGKLTTSTLHSPDFDNIITCSKASVRFLRG